jgi:uncharacterized repeat protein (TIGR01451 family)
MYKYWSHVMLAVLIATNIGLVTKLAVAQINAPGNAAAFVSMQVPSSIAAGEKGTVTVTFKNTGSKTWRSADNYYVGSVCPSRDRIDMFMGDIGSRAALTSDVQPGQEVSISFSVQSNTAGTFSVCYQMVQEGVEWFGDVSATNTISVRTDSGGGTSSSSSVQASSASSSSTPITPPSALGNNATFISMSEIPSQLPVGRSFPVGITYRNTGKTIWTMTNMYRLGSQSPQDNTIWNLLVGGSRIDIEPGSTNSMSVVKPGESVNFFFVITPKKTGTYDFQMKMVQDGKEWFGNPTPKKTIKVIEDSTIAKNNAEFVSLSGVPQSMNVNDTAVVSVKMRNSGNTTWTKKDLYGLGSQSPQDNVIWGGGRAPLSDSVKPSDDATFTFKIHAPEKTGKYAFQWKMVQDGKEWFGEASPLQTITVVDPNANAFNFANFVSITGMPATMAPSQTATVTVTAKNTGTTTWASQKGYYLGSQNPQDNLTWGTSRVALPKPVAPGEQVTFSFQVRAPQKTGTYPFHWRMVQDGKEWFGNPTAVKTITVENEPTADISITASNPTTAERNKSVTYTVTVKNNGPHTAENITTRVGVPSELYQFVPEDSDQLCRDNGKTGVCSGFSLAPGKTRTLELTYTFTAAVGCNSTIALAAQVYSTTKDPNLTNNEFSPLRLLVTCPQAVTGNLYVSSDTTPLRNRQLLAGTEGDTVMRVTFHADKKDSDVTDIQFTSMPGTTAQSIDRLNLYKVGSTVPFATATRTRCGSNSQVSGTFCATMDNGEFIVPADDSITILVKPKMKSDAEGAISGESIQLKIPATKGVFARGLLDNNGNTTAEGEIFIGLTSPAALNKDISSKLHVTVLSKITIIENANFDANGTNVPTGYWDIGSFRFTTAANINSKNGLNKFLLGVIMFTVDAQNVQMDSSSFSFHNRMNNTISKKCEVRSENGLRLSGTVTGKFYVYCEFVEQNQPVNVTIDSGSSQIFDLIGNIVNPKVISTQTSSLQVSLQNLSNANASTVGPNGSQII